MIKGQMICTDGKSHRMFSPEIEAMRTPRENSDSNRRSHCVGGFAKIANKNHNRTKYAFGSAAAVRVKALSNEI